MLTCPNMIDFIVKTPDLRNLEKFYKKAPKQFARASAGMINNLAFETRSAALVNIASDMNIRSDRFVNGRMRVNRARSVPISQQRAEVGSLPTSRFSGWVEQETGKAPARTRTFGIAARRGKERNTVSAKARLKPANQFFSVNDFDLSNAADEDHRTQIFLQLMGKEHANEPFVMRRRYRKMRKGLYVFSKRGKLKQIQEFGKPPHTKRKPWMRPAAHKINTKANVRKQWARAINHVLR